MTSRDARLAGLLLRCQWLLEEAAYELAASRLTSSERDDLAESLTRLTAALREHTAPGTDQADADTATPIDVATPIEGDSSEGESR